MINIHQRNAAFERTQFSIWLIYDESSIKYSSISTSQDFHESWMFRCIVILIQITVLFDCISQPKHNIAYIIAIARTTQRSYIEVKNKKKKTHNNTLPLQMSYGVYIVSF